MLLISQILLVIASPFVGSFLGAVITRWSTGRPLYSGRATCDCGQVVLAARDMIPIASWAVSGGRCRLCARGLGRLYPAIELAALLIAVWSIIELPGNLIWTGAAFGWILLVIGMIAWREGRIPLRLAVPFGLAGLLFAAINQWDGIVDHLIGAVAGFAAYAAVADLLNFWLGRQALRRADAFLPAAIGGWLGWPGLVAALLFGVVVALLMRPLFGVLDRPYGERLIGACFCAGAWIAWLYGPFLFA